MRTRLDELIRAYYQSIGHLRKSTTPSPLRDFRRGIQSKIAPMAATIINVAPSVKDYGGETFICETLAVNMLQVRIMHACPTWEGRRNRSVS